MIAKPPLELRCLGGILFFVLCADDEQRICKNNSSSYAGMPTVCFIITESHVNIFLPHN